MADRPDGGTDPEPVTEALAMHDPELDGSAHKKEPTPPPPRETIRPGGFTLEALLLLWPVSRFAQAVFAEALGQGLVEGLTADHATRLAAEVNPSRRFGRALGRAAMNVRSGYPLAAALEKTGARVRPGLLVALRVGEEHGSLAEELSSFARRTRGFSPGRFLRAIGRSREAVDFAAALARLLAGHPLSVGAVRDAGRVAADGGGRFLRVSEDVARRIENGESLARALGRHRADFDGLYCGFLGSGKSREEMRACLERLGRRP